MSNRYDPETPNSGHGHVYRRPDGMRARCGGSGICSHCLADSIRKKLESKQPSDVMLLKAIELYVVSLQNPEALADSDALLPTEGHQKKVVAAVSKLLDALGAS